MASTFDISRLFSPHKAPSLVGLDIGLASVKLVELSMTGNHITLERYATEALPRNAIIDGNIDNLTQVTDVVRRLWKKSGTRAKYVAIGLPSTSVITKTIILPDNLPEAQLEMQVESEADQYIPFPLDEVSLDFSIIGPATGSAHHIEILLAAARKDKIDDRAAIAQAIGITPYIVDIDAYAARAALQRTLPIIPNKTPVIALFEIGSYHTHLSVLHGAVLVYEREHNFGGHQLTDNISAQYNIPFEEAEAKKKIGGLPKDYKTSVLEPFVDGIGIEVERALQLLFSSTPIDHIDHIIIAGGGALTRGLADAIRTRTSTPIMLANPFQDMLYAKTIRESVMQKEAAQFLVACGLALRKFD